MGRKPEADDGSDSAGELKRVTVRDIAKELGLHFTTVAEALRGSSRVKESTRKMIEDMAVRMGYRVDPILSALSAYRTAIRRHAFQGSIAWLNAFDDPHFFRRSQYFYGDCYRGAMERAESLGYKLEEFHLNEAEMSGRRASQILASRNTLGLVVGPIPFMREKIDIAWDRFNSVRIGYSFRDSRITNVISDQYGNTRVLYARLIGDGFKRIGFACPEYLDDRVGNRFSGAYLAMAHRHFRGVAPPPFIDAQADGDPEAFLTWYHKHRPQVIMAGGRSIYYNILVEAGVRIPQDVQLVSMQVERLRAPIAGMTQNGRKVGSVAVDHLVSMIHGFKVGLESFPKTIMVTGKWVDGETFDPSLLK